MKDFSQLKKNLKKDFSHLKKIKVALLGDSATQFLVQAIRGEGFEQGFDFQIWEADFNQIERQVFDSSSELYQYKPELVIVFESTHKLLNKYNCLTSNEQALLAKNKIELVKNLSQQISTKLSAKIIYFNYNEIDDAVYGNFANQTEISFLYQLRKLNFELMQLAISNPNLYLCDISTLQNQIGKSLFFQSSIYINTEMVLSIDALPLIAKKTVALIASLQGKFKKCLVLDLDNTLWGGIIGDDGMEHIQLGSLGIGKAFTEFQYWIKKLKNRGIIVAICSKNTESIAKEPFEKHPDMVLHLNDIAIFVANWDNKADNIRKIQSVLNIGFDSMVFIDDNPFERHLVRENIPGICVPELPEDPAEYLEFLYTLNLFETVSISSEDANRTKQYQIEAQRASAQQNFTNEVDFLKTLNMQSLVEGFTKFNTPRVAQLTQRSNQFNLRTIRYSELDIKNLQQNNNYFNFAFTLEDKFGDNGLISVVILKYEDKSVLFIENWLMSCRVLKRGMENFVLNTLIDFAKNKGISQLKGEYLPTPKNAMVKDFYKDLGFTYHNNYWFLDTSNYKKKTSYISNKQ